MIKRLRVPIPAGAAGEFFSPQLTLPADLIPCSFHPVLPQWQVKDPGHSAKSAGGRLHLNTYTPLTQRGRNGLTMPLCRHSVGSYPERSSHATCQGTSGQSSQLAEPLWTDPGPESEISARELMSTSKTKLKKRRRGMNGKTFSQSPRKRGKSHQHHLDMCSIKSLEGLVHHQLVFCSVVVLSLVRKVWLTPSAAKFPSLPHWLKTRLKPFMIDSLNLRCCRHA